LRSRHLKSVDGKRWTAKQNNIRHLTLEIAVMAVTSRNEEIFFFTLIAKPSSETTVYRPPSTKFNSPPS